MSDGQVETGGPAPRPFGGLGKVAAGNPIGLRRLPSFFNVFVALLGLPTLGRDEIGTFASRPSWDQPREDELGARHDGGDHHGRRCRSGGLIRSRRLVAGWYFGRWTATTRGILERC